MHTGRSTATPPSLSFPTLLGLSLIVIVSTLVITPTLLAQTQETAIIVDTTEDELNDSGNDCSLREAIQAANTDNPVDGCPAGNGDDAILLPAGGYVLKLAGTDEDANATGDLDITTGTVISMGPGPERTVIDGNQIDRVLHVHAGAAVQIHGIRIARGKTPGGHPGGERSAGGGIYNYQALTLRNSTITYNTAGAIEVDGLGGGIYTRGVLTVTNTILAGNMDVSGSRDCYQDGITFLSLGYNLAESVGTCVFTATGDLTSIVPILGPLGNCGGDTLTYALLPNSPAIDRGSCRDSPTDQRGFLRPIDLAGIPNADDGCDIGAFEYYPTFRIYLSLTMRYGSR